MISAPDEVMGGGGATAGAAGDESTSIGTVSGALDTPGGTGRISGNALAKKSRAVATEPGHSKRAPTVPAPEGRMGGGREHAHRRVTCRVTGLVGDDDTGDDGGAKTSTGGTLGDATRAGDERCGGEVCATAGGESGACGESCDSVPQPAGAFSCEKGADSARTFRNRHLGRRRGGQHQKFMGEEGQLTIHIRRDLLEGLALVVTIEDSGIASIAKDRMAQAKSRAGETLPGDFLEKGAAVVLVNEEVVTVDLDQHVV
ncbi:hypothetical protein C8J57DRAFT_1233101 [Mycena rebaudengoi]|nr:hypothetical protein C8J57DRAFT_1233101 [Mycena rebaudengoi]